MRQFCQELIEHFRNLLVIRSVKKPEEILDLTAAELDELRRQSGHVSALDIQRRLTLLIKADSRNGICQFSTPDYGNGPAEGRPSELLWSRFRS